MQYLTNEIALDLPAPAADRSVNVLTLTDPEHGTPYQVIINRDQLLADETLGQCFERQLGLMTRQAQSFKRVAQRSGRIGPGQIEAVTLESSFAQAGKTFHQLQALFVTEPPQLLVLTLSSHLPLHAGHRQVWARMLRSLQPRAASAPDAPAPPPEPAA
jgi:hypothetical protein